MAVEAGFPGGRAWPPLPAAAIAARRSATPVASPKWPVRKGRSIGVAISLVCAIRCTVQQVIAANRAKGRARPMDGEVTGREGAGRVAARPSGRSASIGVRRRPPHFFAYSLASCCSAAFLSWPLVMPVTSTSLEPAPLTLPETSDSVPPVRSRTVMTAPRAMQTGFPVASLEAVECREQLQVEARGWRHKRRPQRVAHSSIYQFTKAGIPTDSGVVGAKPRSWLMSSMSANV